MNKWQARAERARQELATDINTVLDTPRKELNPKPTFSLYFCRWVRRQIFAEIDTHPLKAVK